MDTIASRRSIRKYKPDEVSRDLIEQIAEAARLAPSAKNRQPWRFIVYTGAQKESLLDVMQQALQKEQQTHALLPGSAGGLPDAFNTLKIMRTAPVIIIVMNTNGKSPFEATDTDSRITEICDTLSVGAAIQDMLLKATELGLGTLWIANTCYAYNDLAGFVGEQGQLVGAIAVGYPDEAPAQRPRKPLGEIIEYR